MIDKSSVLPADAPHIAYVTLWYPVFTQPFIFREVEALKQELPVQVYSLYGHNLRQCSVEMLARSDTARTFGLKALFPVTGAILLETIKNPRKVWKLFRKSCLRKWNTLESFGENLWAFGIGIALGCRFKEDGIDFVYAPWPRGAATAASIGAELAGLKFAIAARGDNLEPADPDLADKMEAASFIRANNAADKKRIENFDKGQAKDKTVLIYNSLTLPEMKGDAVRFKNSSLKILALGRFDVTKGFDVLLQACAILKERGVKFSLTLAGGGGKIMGLGNLETKLRSLRKTLNLEKEVTMPGLVNHDELPELLAASDVFVAPCVIDESGKRDGIPNTVIEAMAAAMPLVATDINALPEVAIQGKTGLTVPQKDAVALADALIWLRNHPDEAVIMGKNGAVLAANLFDTRKNAQLLANALKAQACAA